MTISPHLLVCMCRRGRETGVIQEDELEKEEDLFEYVDDREYAKIVQKRQEEGFVLDDVGKEGRGGRVCVG